MKSRFSVKRAASMILAAGFLFVLVGDRGMTATPLGIDPLEVLNLQIKPNVLIVLDTSGSMNETVLGNGIGGDHADSKLGSAKLVMRQALVTNEAKVNMMFGTYTQSGSNFRETTVQASSNNQDHFSYWAKSSDFPSMLTTELIANQVYAFQIIGNGTAPNARTNNNLLYFTEEIGVTDAVCTATVTPRFYQSGADLATAMQAAMNAATCTVAKANTYLVSYAAGTGIFTFARNTGARAFRMDWSTTTNSIRGVLNRVVATTGNGTSFPSGDARYYILRRLAGDDFTEGAPAITFYEMIVGRFFNGETLYVQANGNVCDMTSGAASTTVPFVNLQLITGAACPAPGAGYGTATGTPSGTAVRFDTDGGIGGGWGQNSISCTGFQIRSQLRACDSFTGQALAINTPFLERTWQIATAAGPVPPAGVIAQAPGGLVNREETLEGVGRFDATGGNILPYGLPGDGSTPIANSLRDLKEVFTRYYNGSAITTATIGTVTLPTSGTINAHVQPRERTIVLFITDGDDTCSGTGDAAARAAAVRAQTLYNPIVGGVQNPSGQYTAGTDAASSVVTYLIGYGNGAQVTRLNMIAWGGSGMRHTFATNPTAADRLLCQTCQDAFVAPNQAALAAILQAIFDQGAQTGEFTAQQSITGPIYEYVDQSNPLPTPAKGFDARNPDNRYQAFTPVKFVSTFTLPGFNGQIKAFSNACNKLNLTNQFEDPNFPGTVCDDSVMLWSAGDKLLSSITTGMRNATGCPILASPGAVDGECRFDQLHASATDATIGLSSAAIKRRIYTTSQNGYYGVTVANLLAGAAPFRISLWPPQAASIPTPVAPTGLTPGLFDDAMGLPLDSAAAPATEFTNLQTTFRVCQNPAAGPLPASPARTNCLSATPLVRMQQARKEAREIILAYMAGATPVVDSQANPKRVTGGVNAGLILYKPKSWILAESSLATPAEVPPPFGSPSATPYTREYDFFRDGYRVGGTNTAAGDNVLAKGFGLANPDKDAATKDPVTGQDTRAIKPVMSVLYAGANDMLHAFRAGSRYSLGFGRTGGTCGNQITVSSQKQLTSAITAAVPDCGGDELWGFVPFDQLGKLYSRVVNVPTKRDPHDYVIARGVRFADVFVPGQTTLNFGPSAADQVTVQGVWRKILYVPRGIGGKYMTAIDVTAPGTFQTPYLQTTGPIPLWSRGNPDTVDGKAAGTPVNSAVDTAAYAAMGQTWSLPAVVYIERTQNTTVRNPGGVDFVAYMGSGYGSTASEGTRIFTLDALTGDVVAAPDVEPVATANGMSRGARSAPGTPPVPYDNAIVANVIAFNPSNFKTLTTAHPSASKTNRVYVGDLYGRFWKVLSSNPNTPLPMADLEDPSGQGGHQPVGTAASLVGLPLDQVTPAPTPFVYVTSGNENREPGPFNIYGFRDDGDDTNLTVAPTTVANNVKTFGPVVSLFTRTYDQGPVLNPSAPTPYSVFRGTNQPATAFTADKKGVVFFAGTRFNPPLSAFAPVPVPGNPATYPCRSTFDSIIYALQAAANLPAYDLNAAGDDAYAIFQESRIVGIGMQADPEPGRGGSRFAADEGQRKPGATEKAPPKPGKPPSGGSNVRLGYRADHPMPAMKFGSTVCQ